MLYILLLLSIIATESYSVNAECGLHSFRVAQLRIHDGNKHRFRSFGHNFAMLHRLSIMTSYYTTRIAQLKGIKENHVVNQR